MSVPNEEQFVTDAWTEIRDSGQWPGIQGTGAAYEHGKFHLVIYVSHLAVAIPERWKGFPTMKRLSGFPKA